MKKEIDKYQILDILSELHIFQHQRESLEFKDVKEHLEYLLEMRIEEDVDIEVLIKKIIKCYDLKMTYEEVQEYFIDKAFAE